MAKRKAPITNEEWIELYGELADLFVQDWADRTGSTVHFVDPATGDRRYTEEAQDVFIRWAERVEDVMTHVLGSQPR